MSFYSIFTRRDRSFGSSFGSAKNKNQVEVRMFFDVSKCDIDPATLVVSGYWSELIDRKDIDISRNADGCASRVCAIYGQTGHSGRSC